MFSVLFLMDNKKFPSAICFITILSSFTDESSFFISSQAISPFFSFFYPCMVEKVLSRIKFLRSTLFELCCIQKSRIEWLVYVFVCYQHNSKINVSRKSKFSILDLYHMEMLLKLFWRSEKSVCAQLHPKKFPCITIHVDRGPIF